MRISFSFSAFRYIFMALIVVVCRCHVLRRADCCAFRSLTKLPQPQIVTIMITIISGIYLPLMSHCIVDIELTENSWQQMGSGFGVSFSAVLALNLSIIGLQ